jgi:hypothetical protein
MLFDLQSRRRRTAVKIIYGLLAVLMGGGLVLLGVGTGSGGGGALNSLIGNGSGGNSAQTSAVSSQLKAAEKKVTADPTSAAAWGSLMQARYEVAGSGSNYDSTTAVFSATGKAELTQVIAAWDKYVALVKGKPDQSTVLLAARAFSATGNFSGATVAWQDFISTAPGETRGYECLAFTAYAASKTSLGDDAAAKVVSLSPKLQKLTVQAAFKSAKSSATTAKQAATEEC